MQPFLSVTGPAAPLPLANIDTDVIMPKQFLKGIDRAGLDAGAFYDLRFDEAGRVRPDFVLNRAAWQDTRFLVVGPNFGCGSSREHAVWGLMQLGIRAVLGAGFAGIFADNAANNGLLLVTLPDAYVAALAGLTADPARNRLTVDLQAQTVAADGLHLAFAVDPLRRDALLRGLDAIGSTLQQAAAIRAFQGAHLAANPWLAL
jgi:3-isopropylmalate/(R)-2-methylmalate dehydratase small subunit